MDPVFGPRSNTIWRVISAVVAMTMVVGICGAFILAQLSPWQTDVGMIPDQPVPFSHAHHVSGLGLDCRYCHTSFDKSSFAGMPTSDTCMNCHSQLYTSQAMLEPVRQSWRTGQPIRWRRVHDLPDFVFFNHSVHVDAGVSCIKCHGHIEDMPMTWKAEQINMSWCLECHRHPTQATGIVHEPVPTLESRDLDLSRINRLIMTNCTECHR